jgi:DNA invertase Pin-like site-specific DNA recombinase
MIAGLLESDVDFIAADMPLANRFTIHILAAVAEYEARLISERTKAAFAAAKARAGSSATRSLRRKDSLTLPERPE